jgi:Plasmid encoded RepA protein
MAEGHREAAHSVLDGGEHNATLGASGIARLIGYGPLENGHAVLRFTYSGFALTSLPHKPQTSETWRLEGHNLTLVLQSGVDRAGNNLGLPYGSYARFILLFLQSEAIRSHSREIELGRACARGS